MEVETDFVGVPHQDKRLRLQLGAEVDEVLSVVSDLSRFQCLNLLREDIRPVEISKQLSKPRSTIQRYLETFKTAKLVDEQGKLTERAIVLLPIFESLVKNLDRAMIALKKEELAKEPRKMRDILAAALEKGPIFGVFDKEQIEDLRRAMKLLDRLPQPQPKKPRE